MLWVPDETGRFPRRPHYGWDEMDQECERIVSAFLLRVEGRVRYPIHTNDLTKLVEEEADSLDLYADFEAEGGGLHGLTDFFVDSKPSVQIARELSEQPTREKRLRTTLTHELGHVVFHQILVALEQPMSLARRADGPPSHTFRCARRHIMGSRRADWMEQQAGHASGAFLMPVTPLRAVIKEVREEFRMALPFATKDPAGRSLVRRTMGQFFVSEDAARVRLLRLGALSESITT